MIEVTHKVGADYVRAKAHEKDSGAVRVVTVTTYGPPSAEIIEAARMKARERVLCDAHEAMIDDALMRRQPT